MLKDRLYRVSFGLAAIAAMTASGVLFAQDDDSAATTAKRPLSVRSIRPFQRSETSASKAPNLYDKSSDEFDYFRDELGRSETSTKTKKRIAEIESRVVYADPMDKPAYDGTPFVNIYDDVLADGEPFDDPDDPDVAYYFDENNILVVATETLDMTTNMVSLLTGTGAQNGAMNGDSGMGAASSSGAMAPLPGSEALAPLPGAELTGAPSAPGAPGAAAPKNAAPVIPSANDDSKMLFPESVDNPYKAEAAPVADEAFDFFKADREFKPTAKASAQGQGQGADGKPFMGSAGSVAELPDD